MNGKHNQNTENVIKIALRGQILTLLVLILCAGANCFAQKGPGQKMGLARRGYQSQIVSIAGQIQEIKSGPCEMTTGKAVHGTHLIMQTSGKKTVNLHLGPEPAVRPLIKELSVGKAIQAKAFRTPRLIENHYIVQFIEIEGEIITLRAENLRPVWAGNHPFSFVAAGEKKSGRTITSTSTADKNTTKISGNSNKSSNLVKPKNRAESLRALMSHLGLGEGAVVADIGAGSGRDTWVFAKIVGKTGTVFAEEITDSMVNSLQSEAAKKELKQVQAVLGRTDDPNLPANSVDFAFMNHVYHHLAKPRKMLKGIWLALKPGGYFVVVDQRRGTLRDWVPRNRREKKHFWIAETTVVREAREEGFAFIDCAEPYYHTDKDFVLIFQRPKETEKSGRDPDPFLPIPVEKSSRLFQPNTRPYRNPVFIALGESRKLIPFILENSVGNGLEIVLEEWATQKEERPPLPDNVSFPSVLTTNGKPNLPDDPIDAVFFLDSYHLLFHGTTLLKELYEKLSPKGCVYVLDRKAKKKLSSRREASHRRQIHPETVKQEMAAAGFSFWFRGPRIAPDRFLLVYGKNKAEKIQLKDDPFIGGPMVSESPGRWIRKNYWRLRGLKTNDGKIGMPPENWSSVSESIIR
jgi:ubiquinone/menaquinone biosynthesis C-methylase UbiE